MPPSLLRLGYAFALATALVALAACRGAAGRDRRSTGADPYGDAATGLAPGERGADAGPAALSAGETPPGDAPVAEVDPGPYATDERFLGLAASFAERVRSATDRLELATGLAFRDRAGPRVLLAAMKDERRAFRVSTEVVGGRRRSLVVVNAEPLVAGTDNPDRVLLRALAQAALDVPGRAHPVPPWFCRYVGFLASGDAADRVLRLARARRRGDAPPRVDAGDPEAADTTGLAVSLLLATRSKPADVRRLVDLVADGDDAAALLPKWIGDTEGEWVGSARRALADAISDADSDDAAEGRLVEARAALAELGPLGLADVLDAKGASTDAPAWYLAEADALRLSAAIRSGDGVGAREVLLRHPPEPATLALLEAPGTYLLDAAEAERLEGGSALAAWERLVRFDRDFPRNPRRDEAFDEMLALFGLLPPDLETLVLERVVKERGTAQIDAKTTKRRVDGLLADDRPGAASRFLASLGARGDAGDLVDVREAILAAETSPTPAARETNRRRAAAWVARPTRAAEADVLDGGAPAADALCDLVPGLPEPARSDAIRLLVRAGGLTRAVGAVVPAWAREPSRRFADLDLLAGEAGYADLYRTVAALDPTPVDAPDVVAAWTFATFGLGADVLAGDDLILTRLKSAEFPIRRKAFEDLLEGDVSSASPALVRRMARDPAILLRRRAVLAAGRLGLVDVGRGALEDPAFGVRAAACTSLAEAKDDASVPRLEAIAKGADADVRVRASAAAALLRFAERGTARYRPIVSLLRDDDPALADAVAHALAPESGPYVARAIASELAAETVDPGARFDRAALFRLFVAYRRATGRDAGYDPSLDEAAVRRIVLSLPEIRSARGDVARPR